MALRWRDGMVKARRVWDRVPVPAEHLIAIGGGLLAQRVRPVLLPDGLRRFGWLLVMAGLAANVAAVLERGDPDLDRPVSLTTSGLHALTRNPMYVAWHGIHLGIMLSVRSAWVVLTWPVAAAAIHPQILREERDLLARFGGEYVAYGLRVPRYLSGAATRSTYT